MPHHDQELLQPNGVKRDTNSRALALVTQTAAVQLTKALTTLSSCFSSERLGIIRVSSYRGRCNPPYFTLSSK